MNYTANYSLIPVLYNSTMVLDIATCSYWEDYHPLSYFGKYINNTSANTSYYDLDMLQFNADVPNKIKNYSFIYQDLKDLYVKYEDLQTGNLQSTANYSNYQQLKTTEETTFVNNELDTGIKMYLSFQGIQDVGKILYKDLVEQSLGSAKVITFNENTYQNKKYELQDRTIIIPPKFPKFKDYYVGLHMEYKVRGINTKKIAIRRMELASLAFDETSNYSIGTRYGDKIYPFVRDNNTFIYKQDNPFTIYKQTSPYLYLTEDSGIYINDYLLSPSLSASAVRGAYIEINSNKEDDFELAGVQLWCRYPEDQMPTNNFKIASIVSTSRTIDIWAYPELNRKRAKIVAIENNSELYDLIFYSDGNAVQYPYINTETWSSIAISLKSIFDLSGITGRLELYNGLTYNNISTYKYLSKVVGISVQQELSWLNITTVINPLSTWNNIKTKYSSWSAFPSELVKTGAYAIDADKVYNSSVGLANTVNEDSSNITIISNGVDTFTDVDLQLIEVVPV
jgi:hypothetical protein